MAGERLSMRKLKEILRQKWEQGRSHREVAASLGLSVGIVSATLERALRAGVDAAGLTALSETELEAQLYPRAAGTAPRRLPDFAYVHTERQHRGVTLQLLHLEYLEEQLGGYRYTQFCEYYRRWCRKRRVSMRQIHRAGEKTFVDYSGKRPVIYDARSGEPRAVELFVGVLGASSYTYAEASASQQMPEFLASQSRMFEFFGGATEVVVPDQLRSAVGDPCRYEPGLQRPYAEWAAHYGTTVIPARPAKPRDKAKVEVGVQVAQRWILARLRHERLDSVAALNVRIRELLPELNDRPMRVYGQSRRQRFEALDRPALRPLPALRWVYAQWKQAKLNIDSHVEFERHYYSAPHPLIGELLELRVSERIVEIYAKGERVASHERSRERGGYTTDPAHLPRSHQQHLAWSPTRLIHWAGTVGAHTQALVRAILADRPHPEQGYRSCLGILRLSKRYPTERLEAACARAHRAGARSYRHVDAILKAGLDRQAESTPADPAPALIHHQNVRGAAYYTEGPSPQGDLFRC
ncbi:MAG: IS21 family transposase [Gemmatimonadaceae bacterium]